MTFWNKCRRTIAAALLALLLCACGGGQPGDIEITLIAKSAESYFWLTCFQGAQAAAVEYSGLHLTIMAPQDEWEYEVQNEMILEAVEQGVDAIIFSASDFENSVTQVEHALDAGIPVITIDSGVNTARHITFIGTDNYEAGRMAARNVVERVGPAAGVGIVSFEESSANGGQRVQGFVDYMADYPGIEILDIYYAPSTYEIAQAAAEQLMENHGEQLRAIATFNELTTIGVGRAVAANGRRDICVVGFDNNIESVQMLEDGIIDSLVVQNSFAMGYLGIQQALAELRGEPVQPDVDTGTVIVTRENMYDTDMEKLLFPFSN